MDFLLFFYSACVLNGVPVEGAYVVVVSEFCARVHVVIVEIVDYWLE